MKNLLKMSFMLIALVALVGCGKDSKKTNATANGIAGTSPYQSLGLNPQDANTLNVLMNHYSCQSGTAGSQRIPPQYFRFDQSSTEFIRIGSPTTNSFQNASFGVTVFGDILVLRRLNNGQAEMTLHLCFEPGLIMPGRNIPRIRIREYPIPNVVNCSAQSFAADVLMYLDNFTQNGFGSLPATQTVKTFAPIFDVPGRTPPTQICSGTGFTGTPGSYPYY